MGAEERQKFAADGYLVQRQILDPTALEPLRQTIDRFVDAHTRRLYDSAKIAHLYDGASFRERWARVAREYHRHPNRQPLPRSWGGAELLDRAVYDLYTHPRLTAIATALLGAELTANGDFWVRPMVPQDAHTTFTWHQDSFYYGGQIRPQLQILSVWIPLVDVDERNGCLRLVPGSHRFGAIPKRPAPHGQFEPEREIGCYGAPLDVPLQVGDVLFFHNLALHASGRNQVENQVRWSIDLRYAPTGQSRAWHGLGEEFNLQYPCFTAHSKDPTQVESWEQWRRRWERKNHLRKGPAMGAQKITHRCAGKADGA